MNERRIGVLCSASACGLWGLFPLYLKALGGARPPEVIAHRVLWLFPFMLLVLGGTRRWQALPEGVFAKRTLLTFLSSATLLSLNWLVFIWAVTVNRVVDASLGYFINPLVSVMLGVLVLRESLRRVQWTAIGLAFLGVIWLWFVLGQPPWIALALAATFGAYGLLRKIAKLGSIDGLALETAMLFPLAALYLGWLVWRDESAFVAADSWGRVLLVLAGPLTGVPLLLFAAGARRIPLSLLGILQYIGPTMQFLLGSFVWHEPFSKPKFVGYALIWCALALYTFESVWSARAKTAKLTVLTESLGVGNPTEIDKAETIHPRF